MWSPHEPNTSACSPFPNTMALGLKFPNLIYGETHSNLSTGFGSGNGHQERGAGLVMLGRMESSTLQNIHLCKSSAHGPLMLFQMPKALQAPRVLYAQRPLPASTRDVHLTFALFLEPLNPTSQARTCILAKVAEWGPLLCQAHPLSLLSRVLITQTRCGMRQTTAQDWKSMC